MIKLLEEDLWIPGKVYAAFVFALVEYQIIELHYEQVSWRDGSHIELNILGQKIKSLL